MSCEPPLLSAFSGGVRLRVRAKPGTTRARKPRIVALGNGAFALELAVAAAPEDGKANKALLALLAQTLGLKTQTLSLKTGQTSRLKLIEITGSSADLTATLMRFLATCEGAELLSP